MDEWQLRPVVPNDFAQVRRLHQECFPIPYRDCYFTMLVHHSDKPARQAAAAEYRRRNDLCSASRALSRCEPEDLFALCVCNADGSLAGLVSTQRMSSERLEQHDLVVTDEDNTWAAWLWSSPPTPYLAGYILTLGVFAEHRRHGLGSKLLAALIDFYRSCHPECRFLYLHVLHSNAAAVRLYRAHGFYQVRRLPNYYLINGKPEDALLFYFNLHADQPPVATDDDATPVSRCFAGIHQLLGWLTSS